MRVVAIIPARGGSKGVPRKNVKLLAGKPLISYPIVAAKSCKSVGRVVVSTEDEEIANVARTYGAEVIARPAELAEDETPTLPVLIHVVKELKKTKWGRLHLLEHYINYGPPKGVKISLSEVKKNWHKLQMDPLRKRLMQLLIWGK